MMRGDGFANIYHFALGDGQDVIDDFGSHADPGDPGDELRFDAGIAPADASARPDAPDLVVRYGSSGDSVRVKDGLTEFPDTRIERLVFADAVCADAEISRRVAAATAPRSRRHSVNAPFVARDYPLRPGRRRLLLGALLRLARRARAT